MLKELTKNQSCPWIVLASTVLLASLLSGCTTRHLSMVNWNSLDPESYKAWAEDEAYEVTWYKQSRQLKQLRQTVRWFLASQFALETEFVLTKFYVL